MRETLARATAMMREARVALMMVGLTALMVACGRQYDLQGRAERFEKAVEAYREQMDNVGLSVVLIHDNRIAYVRHFGVKNLETGEPLNDSTLFRVASISKTFTATGVMQLVEQGRLALTDDVSDLLGYSLRHPDYPDTVITLEMLLSHRSALSDDGGFYAYAPGTGYAYCDCNFTLCGQILERASGERFDRYIARHILEPLGLHGSFWMDTLPRRQLASLYQWHDGVYVCQDERAYASPSESLSHYAMGEDARIFAPASGLKMSAPDLARYVMMHMNYGTAPDGARILGEETSRNMQRPRSFVGDEHYGLGLLTNATYGDSITLTGHLGGAWGMRGAIFFEPEEKYGFVVLSNGGHDKNANDENMLHNGVIRLMMRHFISDWQTD